LSSPNRRTSRCAVLFAARGSTFTRTLGGSAKKAPGADS
jgi:hypothetical protein